MPIGEIAGLQNVVVPAVDLRVGDMLRCGHDLEATVVVRRVDQGEPGRHVRILRCALDAFPKEMARLVLRRAATGCHGLKTMGTAAVKQ